MSILSSFLVFLSFLPCNMEIHDVLQPSDNEENCRMLAVMTMNVGYFLSILGGVFIGELAVGRFNNMMEEHH